ncbi:MAG: DUF1538 domain-containing protein [Oscillospiraceae bacterium]|jgi:hypothetical protein|nr:DUF1538 domain-containing protein [Oscillospiraceae bacterium]
MNNARFKIAKEKIKEKLLESLSSVLPIAVIMFCLSFVFVPTRLDVLLLFLFGAVLVVFGLGVFSMGVDMAISRMGAHIGAQITQKRNMTFLLVTGFIMGFIVTVAEPDLQVLAEKVTALPNLILILTIAFGVAFSLVIGLLRTVRGFPLRTVLLISYGMVFILSVFIDKGFVPTSFDAGGVTTGAMTVPFILSLGAGVSSVRSDKNSAADSFGLVALSSIGPILVMLLLGLIAKPTVDEYTQTTIVAAVADSTDLFQKFFHGSGQYFMEVALSLFPLVIVYVLFQILNRSRPDKHETQHIVVGTVYAYVGLVVFLTGVNVGFMPAGSYLGFEIASMPWKWALIPLGLIIGYFLVAAEPAVRVLVNQVEEMTEGAVSAKSVKTGLALGVGISVALAMLRVLTGLSLYWIILPGYVIALALTFFSPNLFTAIAFDSGGVASGPMSSTFLLPFAIGACQAVGGNVAKDAFGLIALVAMTPLITIQIMGVVFSRKAIEHKPSVIPSNEIIELDAEEGLVLPDAEGTLVRSPDSHDLSPSAGNVIDFTESGSIIEADVSDGEPELYDGGADADMVEVAALSQNPVE